MMGSALDPMAVHLASFPGRGYFGGEPVPAPELRGGLAKSTAEIGLRDLFRSAGLDATRFGAANWNPLADLVARGERVLIKPNWVSHRNLSGEGIECLVTHTSLVAALLAYLAKTGAASVVIGDAPVQGCDFQALRLETEIDRLVDSFGNDLPGISVGDFRVSFLKSGRFWANRGQTSRTAADNILFDLGADSLLEPISKPRGTFRVTMYDPRSMAESHAPGRHRYLVAREAIEADVVFNLPKLKTHKKAGITGAIKNVVGICGNKGFLPHHRKGHPGAGGDCYYEASKLKAWAEDLLDRGNEARGSFSKYMFVRMAEAARRMAKARGHSPDLEGSWHGNDTVWRMSLDLQRVLHYGGLDGRLSTPLKRRVITITDAIIAGEGDGPLAPTPVPLGVMTLSGNVAAAEWVHAYLMRLEPSRLPIVREAFGDFSFRIADFKPSDVRVKADNTLLSAHDVAERFGVAFQPSRGWKGHCEMPMEQPLAC